jgi:hypothetical protein
LGERIFAKGEYPDIIISEQYSGTNSNALA